MILALLLVLAAGFASYFVWRGVKPAEASRSGPPPVPVSIANAARKDVPIYLTGLGTVQATFTVGIHSQVDGKLQDVFFKEGQHVKKDEVLAKIDPRLFKAALDQAKAKKAQDTASLANANLDLQRFTKLGEFATRQQTDTQRSTVAQLTAQLEADDAAIFNAQTQVDYTSVKAPISGVAGLRQFDVGNIVNASTQTGIVTIAQIEPIAVIFTAPEDQLPYINQAQAAEPLKVIALTTDGGKTLSEGALSVVNNQVDARAAPSASRRYSTTGITRYGRGSRFQRGCW